MKFDVSIFEFDIKFFFLSSKSSNSLLIKNIFFKEFIPLCILLIKSFKTSLKTSILFFKINIFSFTFSLLSLIDLYLI